MLWSRRIILQTLVFCPSYLHPQVSPLETLVVKRETTWARIGRWILPENARLPRNIQGFFTCRKSTTWDKWLYFPSEGRRAEDIFALKNPTASAGFEPANLCTKGQHATSRAPKPLCKVLSLNSYFVLYFISPSGASHDFFFLLHVLWFLHYTLIYVLFIDAGSSPQIALYSMVFSEGRMN